MAAIDNADEAATINFPFPFEPWPIQKEFMASLYSTLDQGKVSIFESPTGTGKSLSLICGALKWLRDQQNASLQSQIEAQIQSQAPLTVNDSEPEWVKEHHFKKRRDLATSLVQQEIERKRKWHNKRDQLRRLERFESKKMGGFTKKIKTDIDPNARTTDKETDPQDAFLVDGYFSDGDVSNRAQVKSIMDELEKEERQKKVRPSEDEDVMEETLQIFYCSRTHSQLSQFVREIKKTVYEDVKCVTLGSRKNLCMNSDVLKLSSLPRINDRCLDLQKDKKKGCSYNTEFSNRKHEFVNHAQSSIRDIEELADLGRDMGVCAYYGSRESIKSSEIVVLPYNLILQKSARESLGVNLKNKIVIFDEAHNIIETICSIYSVSVDRASIHRAKFQLTEYFSRYSKRLLGKNIVYIKQIQMLLDALLLKMTSSTTSRDQKKKGLVEEIQTVNDFMHDLDIDHLNVFKIDHYLKESRLAQKLQGYVTDKIVNKENNDGNSEQYIPKHVSALQQVQAFLMSLTNATIDGQVITATSDSENESYFKYLLLNPAGSFNEIVDEAHSVILAGGTMEPHQDFIEQLYPNVPVNRLGHFSCGHVIPKTSILTLCVDKGVSGSDFMFTYENRMDTQPIHDLGDSICTYAKSIPSGIVCFFVSYAYMDHVVSVWKKLGVMDKLSKIKKAFMEPRTASASNAILKQYEAEIQAPNSKGAILLSVVGGKMSEGINFSDELGRGIILIGLPFPNLGSKELQKKLEYMNHQSSTSASATKGTDYYENLCMRAVNQSIGRAIRHIKDYSVIILIDKRFRQDRIRAKLPGWIRNAGLTDPVDVGDSLDKIEKFFQFNGQGPAR